MHKPLHWVWRSQVVQVFKGSAWRFILGIMLTWLIVVAYGLVINSTTFQVFGELVNRVETSEQVVALTFDDGPQPPYTGEIIRLLGRYQAKGTFFAIGRNVKAYPEWVQQAIASGHEVHNHSYSHSKLVLHSFHSPGFIRAEVEQTDRILQVNGVSGPIQFRAPYGVKFLVLPYVLAQMGKANVLWDVNPEDYAAERPEVIRDRVLEAVRPGSIVLLHDGGGDRAKTVAATELILQDLSRRGFQFLSISQLLDRRAPSKST